MPHVYFDLKELRGLLTLREMEKGTLEQILDTSGMTFK